MLKNFVGDNKFFVKCTDIDLNYEIIELKINVINVNDPPFVTRKNAINISSGYWEERISVNEVKLLGDLI